ncbi:MAG: hypothetical protein ACYS80_20225 [Planctomycetota bacterium]|jgi:hypothetical protein
MATKNIGGGSNDPFYRYKRNIIEVEYNRRKGGTTTITNMALIQGQLHMPDTFTKAFYKKIKKTGKAMTSPGTFRGEIQVSEFEAILEAMIAKHVLCPRCRLPEWDGNSCAACGHG